LCRDEPRFDTSHWRVIRADLTAGPSSAVVGASCHDEKHTEDVAIGYGFQSIEPALVPTMTVGTARAEEQLSEQVRSVLLGLGFS